MGHKPEVRFVRVRSALTPSGLPDIDYALNPYLGCSHGCRYCYGPGYVADAEVRERWGEVVAVKENLPEVLESEAKRREKGVVGVGTVCDAYQPLEAVYLLTRYSLKALLSAGFRVSVQTKSTLVLRDLDILTNYRERADVGFTITTLDRRKAALLEPYAPPPEQRLRALRVLSASGLKVWLFVGPIVNSGDRKLKEDLRSLVEAALPFVEKIYYDRLRLKRIMPKADKAVSRMLARSARESEELVALMEEVCEELGAPCTPAFSDIAQRKLSVSR